MPRRDASDRHRLPARRRRRRGMRGRHRGARRATRRPTAGPCSSTSAAPAATPSTAANAYGLEARGPAPGRRAHERAELQHAQGEPATTPSSPSATAASRARSCPRTSWSGKDAEAGRRLPRASTRASERLAEQASGRDARPQGRSARTRSRRARRSARRGVDADVLDEALELDERRRALLPELEELRARKNAGQQADRRAAAERRGRLRGDRGDARRLGAREAARRGAARRWRSGGRGARRAAEPARPDRRRPRTRCCARWARPGRTGRDHLELLGELVDMEARRARGGLALRVPEGRRWCWLEFALVQLGARAARASRASRP